jgi:glycosyltransferase involved in cell wall biosynthesis
MPKKRLVFTVTSNLAYDQRMQRICSSLQQAGYSVLLIGRKLKGDAPLAREEFKQLRLNCFFQKGPLFYITYNIQLFFVLLFTRASVFCAIDLDTILPVYFASVLRGKIRVYDAHELFCEMKEIVTRPRIYWMWKKIEQFALPRFPHGYTVNQPIADAFYNMYQVRYGVIRNIALLRPLEKIEAHLPYFLYQGAVNEGRCFETLIPAMQQVSCPLWICGTGNFLAQAEQLVAANGLTKRVIFKGNVLPKELRRITRNAYAGITLFDDTGSSNYYSLANRFFDYLHAGIPQLCVDYPVYSSINAEHHIALLIRNTNSENIARQMNKLLNDEVLYEQLQANCETARQQLNWQQESKILLSFYEQLLRVDKISNTQT